MMTDSDPDEVGGLMTGPQMAQAPGLTDSAAYAMGSSGRLRCVMIAGHRVVPVSAVESPKARIQR
jgi:hypothetical protein